MAAVDYFLKITGVDGESKDSKHKGEIEILSWQFGHQQTGTESSGGGGGAGKVLAGDFNFTMKVSKASPKLFLACATGEHYKTAVVVARKAGKEQQEYLKWTFTDLLVTSFHTSGSGGSDILPTDNVSMNFAKLEVEYKEQNEDGSLGGATKAGYHYKENKVV
ncbi:MAG TPA: type VI secretion system tube protein Hcp [Thermoanaerobaculia bacterium]|jgi:type VI secretion system secreted protein Hcp